MCPHIYVRHASSRVSAPADEQEWCADPLLQQPTLPDDVHVPHDFTDRLNDVDRVVNEITKVGRYISDHTMEQVHQANRQRDTAAYLKEKGLTFEKLEAYLVYKQAQRTHLKWCVQAKKANRTFGHCLTQWDEYRNARRWAPSHDKQRAASANGFDCGWLVLRFHSPSSALVNVCRTAPKLQ